MRKSRFLFKLRKPIDILGVHSLRRLMWGFRVLYVLLICCLAFSVMASIFYWDFNSALWFVSFLTVLFAGPLLVLMAPLYNWVQRKGDRKSIPWSVISWSVPLLAVGYLIILNQVLSKIS